MLIDISTPKFPNTYTVIDEEDYDRIKMFKFHPSQKPQKTIYAVGHRKGKDKRLHRLIMNCPDGLVVDHINGDGLDNRKVNLRICTVRENARNCRRSKLKEGRWKGVYKDKRKNGKVYLKSKIKIDGKSIHIGHFKTEIECAKAYNKKAKELFGEFACLNEFD